MGSELVTPQGLGVSTFPRSPMKGYTNSALVFGWSVGRGAVRKVSGFVRSLSLPFQHRSLILRTRRWELGLSLCTVSRVTLQIQGS